MSSHQHIANSGSQNLGNIIGTKSSVRQSKLYRIHESGNAMKDLLGFGSDNLKWDINKQQGAYQGGVYDHNEPYQKKQTSQVTKNVQQSNFGNPNFKENFNVQAQINNQQLQLKQQDSHNNILKTRPW